VPPPLRALLHRPSQFEAGPSLPLSPPPRHTSNFYLGGSLVI